tara:strand:- start:3700 stop:5154 length:1455 start_codon:yes stop_codon:yes gene_type:complete
MSIEERRNSVLRSSISIKSIQKTIGSFQEGLTKAKTTSGEIVKQTREKNLFKSKLVSQDNKFFQQRRENVRRREREDELESASTTGVTKKQGNIITRSTKGFLGRVLDFFAISLLGFFVTVLPGLLKKFSFFIILIQKSVEVLKFFTDGLADFLVDIQEGLFRQIEKIKRVDFSELNFKLREKTDDLVNGLLKLNRNLFQGGKLFSDLAKDINQESLPILDEISEEEQRAQDAKDFLINEGMDQDIPEEERNKILDGIKDIEDGRRGTDEQTGSITPSQQEDNKNLKKDNLNKNIFDRFNFFNRPKKETPGPPIDKDRDNNKKESISNNNVDENNVDNNQKISDKDVNDALKNITNNSTLARANEQIEAAKNSNDDNEFDLEPEEGYVNIDGMFDPVGTSNKRKKTEFGPGEFDNVIVVSKTPPPDTISQDRKSDTIIVMNNNNMDSASVNTSGGGSSSTNIAMNTSNDKTTMKKIQSKILSGY